MSRLLNADGARIRQDPKMAAAYACDVFISAESEHFPLTRRKHGFNGLITMTSRGLCREIARVARHVGFVKIIIGVWDVRDAGEVGNAPSVSAWAAAHCLGHRGTERRYPLFDLEAAISRVRFTTHRPATCHAPRDSPGSFGSMARASI
jgi:hypothetical protein